MTLQEENEKLRELLREAAKFIDTGDMRGLNMIEVHAALSQQAKQQPEQDDTALFEALYKGQVAAEKAGMVNGTTQWGLCLLRHIRAALSAQGESHE